MHKRPQGKNIGKRPTGAKSRAHQETELRIIGGSFRGRKFFYNGDPQTRPMKDRVREALFNLIADDVRDAVAIDLFAGTGALALEALSRGAKRAICLEDHLRTFATLQKNVQLLGCQDRCQAQLINAFLWATSADVRGDRCLVFFSPPYAFYHDRTEQMQELIQQFQQQSAPGSTLVVECDSPAFLADLPDAAEWFTRAYPPAVLGIWRSPQSQPQEQPTSSE